jgi:hypothetical protein
MRKTIASGSPAGVEWFPNYGYCGINGHFYAASHSGSYAGGSVGWVYGSVNSPVDAYCDNVNPGCP